LWDFGDGQTSEERNPTHIYEAPGTYTVSLTVANDLGEDTKVKTGFVTVVAVVAKFTAVPSSGSTMYRYSEVQFTDQSEGVVSSWLWDFGDGTTSSEQNPSHAYAEQGVYSVTLTVSNEHGSSTTDPGDYYIQVLRHDLEFVLAAPAAPWAARINPHVVAFQNKLWLIGGTVGTGFYDTSDYRDVWNSSDGVNWALVTASPQWASSVTHGYGVVIFNNMLWVIGQGESWCSNDGVDWFLVATGAPWGRKRVWHSTIVFKGMLWVFGGIDSDDVYTAKRDVWRSSDGANWTHVGDIDVSLESRRKEMAATVFNDKLWMFGGWNCIAGGCSAHGGAWCTGDGITWEWLSREAVDGRVRFTALAFNDQMWITGRGNVTYTSLREILRSTDGVNWSEPAIYPTDWVDIGGPGAVLHNGKLWLLGGIDDTGLLNKVWYAEVGEESVLPRVVCGAPFFRNIGMHIPGGIVAGKGPRKRR
jgi:PKD repeat protein